jgi:AsmA-like C-terminal region
VQPEDLRVSIPEKVPPAMRLHPPAKHETDVGEFVADGAVLDVRGLTLRFLRLRLQDLSRKSAIRVEAKVLLPNPRGTAEASGVFGPWEGAASALSGSFTLKGADLSKYDSLSGILTGSGKFQGTLAALEVNGRAGVASFRVRRKGPATAVHAEYRASVNGTTGETRLEGAQFQFLKTHLAVSGSIGKTTTLDFDGRQSYVEDLLRVFASSDEPAMRGPISFRARVVLPPGDTPFLRRVLLDGRFGIDDGQFKPRTQDNIEKLSSRARGQDKDVRPANINSDVQGNVRMRDGVARLDGMRFIVPGAVANGSGTFNLITKRVDLRGTVAMDATLSEAAGGGIKSFFLKPLNVFYRDKKKNAGAVLPVNITGTYPHAKAQVSLTGKH